MKRRCDFMLAACLLLIVTAESVTAQNAALNVPAPNSKANDDPFLAKPYLQLGHAQVPGKLELVWHAADADAVWAVEYQAGTEMRWQAAGQPAARTIDVRGITPHRIYHVALTGMKPGEMFGYRVSRNGQVVFSAEALAPKSAVQPQRFVVFGDCGAGTPAEKEIVYRTYLSKPDLVMITGDIVYSEGRISEYRKKYWPILNADEASPSKGAPLLRSTLTTAAPGNHDISQRDLGRKPDGLAYFFYWLQPLNGPTGVEGGPLVARLFGNVDNKKAFLAAAGDAFPRMANFSFDYGNAHWTVLDASVTVDLSNRELQDWLVKDLAAAKGAAWRFVSFHQPGFNSSKSHFGEQQTRLLAPIFEAAKVDIVFAGHVHNYQRSYPLRFVPDADKAAGANGARSRRIRVNGKWTLDKTFDGQSDTTPEGVIYIVTGAGGQHLYNPEQQDNPASWQDFTCKHISKSYSLTLVDVDAAKLTLRQLTADGNEVDRFVVTK